MEHKGNTIRPRRRNKGTRRYVLLRMRRQSATVSSWIINVPSPALRARGRRALIRLDPVMRYRAATIS
jgi:hypothetical protein